MQLKQKKQVLAFFTSGWTRIKPVQSWKRTQFGSNLFKLNLNRESWFVLNQAKLVLERVWLGLTLEPGDGLIGFDFGSWLYSNHVKQLLKRHCLSIIGSNDVVLSMSCKLKLQIWITHSSYELKLNFEFRT